MDNNVKLCSDVTLSSEEYEQLLQAEYMNNKVVTRVNLPLSARNFKVPSLNGRSGSHPERTISMTGETTPDKKTLYQLIVAAYNYAYNDQSAAVTAKMLFNCHAHLFVEWLNSAEITNRYTLLKKYEAYRFDLLNNHGGASVLSHIKTIFTYALDYSTELNLELSKDEINYLEDLRKTPISPNLNKVQKSLASYFGGMSWLRCDDFGIGNELYAALASPKLAIKSLITTASTLIDNVCDYKRELRNFFKVMKLEASRFILPNSGNSIKQRYKGTIIYEILTTYHSIAKPSETLTNALKCLLLSNIKNEGALNKTLLALNSQGECDSIFLNKVSPRDLVNADFSTATFSSGASSYLFSFDILQKIAEEDAMIPATNIDDALFQWLMASLTVQPSDIKKLTNKSFRLLKVGGKVKHIECKYFKGRAKVFHTTRSISSRSIEGKAVLIYLNMKESGEYLAPVLNDYIISSTFMSLSGLLKKLLTLDGINERLICEHQKLDNLPLLIPSVLVALTTHGIHAQNVLRTNTKDTPLKERHKLASQTGTLSNGCLFRLMLIKNSAVHAFSDPYTLEYLVNKNSHTNRTEKENYLTDQNTEWINSSGRITREVMFDLTNNVFNLKIGGLGKREQEETVERFNSEFMTVAEDISYRTSEMIARLQIVTGQVKGKINEVGVLALNENVNSDQFSPIYVLDSPVTAWKMYNYLHEFKKSYKKLLAQNPEYLYKTALPSVEWIEHSLNKLSKDNQKHGIRMFESALNNDVVVSVFHSI